MIELKKLVFGIVPYVFLLFSVLVISDFLKNKQLFVPIIDFILKKIKNKKLLLFLFVNVLGFLPVPGRIVLACGMLDSIQNKEKNNQKMGILAYLSSHHYYLWSPLEKSIIITIGVAGISYFQFLHLLFPAIVTYFILLMFAYFVWIKNDDINILGLDNSIKVNPIEVKYILMSGLLGLVIALLIHNYFSFFLIFLIGMILLDYNQFFKSLKNINYNLIIFLAVLMIATHFLKLYGTPYFKSISQSSSVLILFVILSFIGSVILGSSSRYAALTGIGISLFGNHYLPLLYLIDFAGYFISPTHKCTIISKMYFNVPFFYFYGTLLVFVSIVVLGGQIIYLF